VDELVQVVIGFINGYKSWKYSATNYKTRIDKTIDQDFWKEEWEKEIKGFYTKQ
jgi:hypothetical protein